MYNVYEPHEDSFLLLKQVPKYARGDVLDMGTGSGIIALEAAKYAKNVLAVDVNPYSVTYVHERSQRAKNLTVRHSDLFKNVAGKFDVIFFNPPYLPNDARVSDLALDGGKHGYEIIDEFLLYARQHLKKKGAVLLLFSSLSKPEHIHNTLKTNGYKYKQISFLKLDFEELYIYEIRADEKRVPGQRKKRSGLQSALERKGSRGKRKKPRKQSNK